MDIRKRNPLWAGGYFVYHQVKHSKIPHYASSRHSFVFMDLRTNSCYSLVQNWLVFYNREGACLLWGTDWICKYNSRYFSVSPCQCHSTNAPHSSWSTYCSYRMDKSSYTQCSFASRRVLGGQVLCLCKSAVKVVYHGWGHYSSASDRNGSCSSPVYSNWVSSENRLETATDLWPC